MVSTPEPGPLDPTDLSHPETLVGRWRWTRHVEDRYAGRVLAARGTLELAPIDAGRLTWSEEGRLDRPDGSSVEVSRRLRLEDRADGWWVTFDHGGDFHPWTPGVEVVHPCGADSYRGLVTGSWSRWQVVWEVTGPRKDHTITTVLSGWVALSAVSRRVEP